MPRGKIEVTAVSARGLKETGMFDKMDPFVGFYVDPAHKHRTRSHVDGGSDPQWNQTISVDLQDSHNTLFVEVFDEDPRSSDLIGGVALPLDQVFRSGFQDSWIPIQRPNGKSAGEIHLILKVAGQGVPTGYQSPHPPGSQTIGGYSPPPPLSSSSPPSYGNPSLGYPPEKRSFDQGSPYDGLPRYDGPPTGYPDEKSSIYASLGPNQPYPSSYGRAPPPPLQKIPSSQQYRPSGAGYSPPAAEGYQSYSPGGYSNPEGYGQPPQYGQPSHFGQGQGRDQQGVGGYPSPAGSAQGPRVDQGQGQQAGTPGTDGKKPIPDWMKLGGAALAGAAALGLGTFVVDEIKDHEQEKHRPHVYHIEGQGGHHHHGRREIEEEEERRDDVWQ
ncbi:C2 domain-containing protein [Endogone sp. FLAS-F59071]|nr:C2 domain-containing protein [Endogone sp. FLAS-F59071]|eukprot:RUS18317.1 C2 domain-containing protein [Endogone sp. FLAS-F59071]